MHNVAVSDVVVRTRAYIRDLVVLSKGGITLFVVMMATVGFVVAGGETGWQLILTLVGTALITAGAGALNQYMEQTLDAQMSRTRHRPLPAGRMHPSFAFTYGLATSLAGTTVLTLAGRWPVALALVAWFTYLLIYTPLKRLTWLCNVPGAVAGAIPPLIGWSAARGSLDPPAWTLFAILWLWQWPHLLTLAWLYRDEMEAAGYALLPQASYGNGKDPVVVLITGSTLALWVMGYLPIGFRMVGWLFFIVQTVLGWGMAQAALRFHRHPHPNGARQLFGLSLLYLVAISTAMVVESVIS